MKNLDKLCTICPMSPELKTENGKVIADKHKYDSVIDVADAKNLASNIQSLVKARDYAGIVSELKKIFPASYAEEFTIAALEKRAGSIKYNVHKDGDIQIDEICCSEDNKRNNKPLSDR